MTNRYNPTRSMAHHLSGYGRYGDDQLVHMNRHEVAALDGIAAHFGRKLTYNPHTGLKEAFNIFDILPIALNFIPGIGTAASIALSAASGAASSAVEGGNPLEGALMGGLTGALGAGMNGPANAATTGAEAIGMADVSKIADPALSSSLAQDIAKTTTAAGLPADMTATQAAKIAGDAQIAQAGFNPVQGVPEYLQKPGFTGWTDPSAISAPSSPGMFGNTFTDILGKGTDADIQNSLSSIWKKENLPYTMMGATALSMMPDLFSGSGPGMSGEYKDIPEAFPSSPRMVNPDYNPDMAAFGEQPAFSSGVDYLGRGYADGGAVGGEGKKPRSLADLARTMREIPDPRPQLTIEDFKSLGPGAGLFAIPSILLDVLFRPSPEEKVYPPNSLGGLAASLRNPPEQDDSAGAFARMVKRRARSGYADGGAVGGKDGGFNFEGMFGGVLPMIVDGFTDGNKFGSGILGLALNKRKPWQYSNNPAMGPMASMAPQDQGYAAGGEVTTMPIGFARGVTPGAGRKSLSDVLSKGRGVTTLPIKPPIAVRPPIQATDMNKLFAGNNPLIRPAPMTNIPLPGQSPQVMPSQPQGMPGMNMGGIVGYADGGMVDQGMQMDDQSVVKEAIMALSGQSDSPDEAIAMFVDRFGEQALQALMAKLQGSGQGGRYMEGPGDGLSDSIPAMVDGQQPSALSSGEFVVPADAVSHLGNGSNQAGAKELYSMIDRLRQARTGTAESPPAINQQGIMPA